MLNKKLKNKPIVFTQLKPSLWQYKLAIALKKAGQKTTLISILKGYEKNKFSESFDEIISLNLDNLKPSTIIKKIFLKPKFFFSFFFRLFTIKPKVAICEGAPHYIAAMFIRIFKNRCPRIYFPYDMNFSRLSDPAIYFPKREAWGERSCFLNCDAIFYKGHKKELELVPKDIADLSKKPSLCVPAYTLKDFYAPYNPQEKISYKKKQSGMHIVNVSFFSFDTPLYASMVSDSIEIVKQKIHLHSYGNNFGLKDKIIQEIAAEDLSLKDYIHIHGFVSPEKLSNEIRKYDYGIYQTGFSKNVKPDAVKYISGNAISSYLEAALPIILKDENWVNSLMVKDNKIGISLKNFKNLKIEIERVNYDKISKNVLQFREKFSFEENIKAIINFIDSLSSKFFNKTH